MVSLAVQCLALGDREAVGGNLLQPLVRSVAFILHKVDRPRPRFQRQLFENRLDQILLCEVLGDLTDIPAPELMRWISNYPFQ